MHGCPKRRQPNEAAGWCAPASSHGIPLPGCVACHTHPGMTAARIAALTAPPRAELVHGRHRSDRLRSRDRASQRATKHRRGRPQALTSLGSVRSWPNAASAATTGTRSSFPVILRCPPNRFERVGLEPGAIATQLTVISRGQDFPPNRATDGARTRPQQARTRGHDCSSKLAPLSQEGTGIPQFLAATNAQCTNPGEP